MEQVTWQLSQRELRLIGQYLILFRANLSSIKGTSEITIDLIIFVYLINLFMDIIIKYLTYHYKN
jgi:hypothetical protein